MPLWMQSTIKNIFNVSFVDYAKITAHLDVLHQKIVKEKADLEAGINIIGKKIILTIHTYIGDNLEIHQVSGL